MVGYLKSDVGFFITGIWEWAVALKSYQQLFTLTKNPKYVKMRLPGKTGGHQN